MGFQGDRDALSPRKNRPHAVVLTSTVLPGAMRYGLLPILESGKSGSRRGGDFGLCYSPEFIALGSIIRDFLDPDFLLIGDLMPAPATIWGRATPTSCSDTHAVQRMTSRTPS